MGLRYRKKVKVAPGAFLNLSKSGVSITLKASKGISVNIGKNGTYLNTGISGTGLYSRQNISGKTTKRKSFTNLKQKPNIGSRYTFWPLLVFVMIGVFIIGLVIRDNTLIGLSVTGIIVFIICAFISKAIWRIKKSKMTKKKHTLSENNARTLTIGPYNDVSNEFNSAESLFEEKRTISEEMVQKLLSPFTTPVEEIPSDRDPLYSQAKRLVVQQQKATIVMIQREFQISNHRAGRIIDQLEKDGVVGTARGSQPRRVLIRNIDWLYLNPTLEQVVQATKLVVTSQLASTSLIQRNLQIGYHISAQIIDRLEESGIVGPYLREQNRTVLINSLDGFEDLVIKYTSNYPNEPLFLPTK